MILQCVIVGQKIFPTRDDAKLGRERSLQNSPAARSEKIFRGLVLHHHSLKISFGLHEHTEMPQFIHDNFCLLFIYKNQVSKPITKGDLKLIFVIHRFD